ncbi:MAG: hypothetical protein D6721_00715 [Gammaproteobacteria bacterium]|nr:MAG: hypothetical protein D6721_00715 [Gammaproteobacteria bacterium]
MIITATDFGFEGPYLGQMKAVLLREAPGVPVLDLIADLPAFEVRAAAHLLAAAIHDLPQDAVVLGVVDPGVGTERGACVVQADGRWFVGPDNGLFDVLAARADRLAWWNLDWRPERLSNSFHGRDLFAPVAARIARGEPVPGTPVDPAGRLDPAAGADWPAVVYADRFGNLMTGLRAAFVPREAVVRAGGVELHYARTFGAVPVGAAFWYENALGLVELAVHRGSARARLGLAVGDPVEVLPEQASR